MLAQFPPVVAPKDDDGVVGKLEFVERAKQPAYLGVDEADRSVIAVFEPSLPVLRE